MTITPKHSVGDKFFGMKENKIVEVEVTAIDIHIEEDMEPRISYRLFTKDSAFWGNVDEDQPFFFKTKEDLLATL